MNLKMTIGALIEIMLGMVLLPIIITFKTNAQTAINDTASAEHVIVGLVPMFWTLGVLGVGAGLIYTSFKMGK